MKYFQSKVSYVKYDEAGNQKKVSETYLFDSVGYADAEVETYKFLEDRINEEFKVVSIREVEYQEILNSGSDDGVFYKVRIASNNIKDDGSIKKVRNNFLIMSYDIMDCMGFANLWIGSDDAEIESVSLTAILKFIQNDRLADLI